MATEMKMLRWIQGKTKISHHKCYHPEKGTREDEIVMVRSYTGGDDGNVAKSVLTTHIEGSRPRGRPRLRWMDRLKQDRYMVEKQWQSFWRYEICRHVDHAYSSL